MNRTILFPIFLTFVILIACAAPPPTEPTTGLDGRYAGTYAYIFNPGDGPDTIIQAVLVTFTPVTFSMSADTAASGYDPSVCFCRVFGLYALTDRIRIEDPGDDPIPDNCEVCNPEWSPYGTFMLEQPTGGLKLKRIDSTGPERITTQFVLTKLGPA